MLSDVRDYYGLVREIGQAGQAGYFETTQLQQIHKELKLAIKEGKLIALSGIVGTGKTTILQQIEPRRVCRRPVLLSHAAMAMSSAWA
jgi:ABC-type glutathione transport system ATPase component